MKKLLALVILFSSSSLLSWWGIQSCKCRAAGTAYSTYNIVANNVGVGKNICEGACGACDPYPVGYWDGQGKYNQC